MKMDKILQKLNRLNPDVDIHSVESSEFQSYGRILRGYKILPVLSLVEHLVPGSGAATVNQLDLSGEQGEVPAALMRDVYGGGTDLQVGAVYGRNTRLDALEYHKCAEVMVSALPMVLLAGLVCEIEWPKGTYDLSLIRAFYVPGGTALEIHPWCLRCNPVHVHEADGFKCLVILSRGTNLPMDDYTPGREGEAKLMLGRNRWLLAHQDHQKIYGKAAHYGLVGRNIELKTL